MLPGPVKVDPRVLAAMGRSVINHRGAEFRTVNKDIREGLRYLFQAKTGEVAAISGSGTAGLEAVVSSLLRREDRVLCLVSGKFSERGFELAKLFANPTQLEFPWGKPMDVGTVAAALEGGSYRALTICHNETSTATTNPLKEIASLCREHDVLCLVDGITSVGGIDVRPEWGLDGVVMGSQKCIAAPAGLAGVYVSKRAYEQLHEDASYYLDLKAHVDLLRDDEDTPYTPSIPLFLAVREALRLLREEGLEARIARTTKLGEACRAAVKALGLTLYPDASVASNTVTAINYPPGIDDGKFRRALLEKHGVVIAGGQAQLKGKIFRIGHMGICSLEDLRATWAAIEGLLGDMGHRAKAGVAAREVVARM